MQLLNPFLAAEAANTVYGVATGLDADKLFRPTMIRDKFDFASTARFDGVSGGVVLKSKTGFGIAARGKGEFEGDALIAIRGTATLFDGITDAYVGNLYPSTTGKMVHSGFNKVFLSFKQELETFFSQFSPRRVHCVGHGLGGGLVSRD